MNAAPLTKSVRVRDGEVHRSLNLVQADISRRQPEFQPVFAGSQRKRFHGALDGTWPLQALQYGARQGRDEAEQALSHRVVDAERNGGILDWPRRVQLDPNSKGAAQRYELCRLLVIV